MVIENFTFQPEIVLYGIRDVGNIYQLRTILRPSDSDGRQTTYLHLVNVDTLNLSKKKTD